MNNSSSTVTSKASPGTPRRMGVTLRQRKIAASKPSTTLGDVGSAQRRRPFVKQAATVVVWRRFLRWKNGRQVWGQWCPQFEVRDVRKHRDADSPSFQIRNLLRHADAQYARQRTEWIRTGQRPIGQSWRITRR